MRRGRLVGTIRINVTNILKCNKVNNLTIEMFLLFVLLNLCYLMRGSM